VETDHDKAEFGYWTNSQDGNQWTGIGQINFKRLKWIWSRLNTIQISC